MQTFWPSRNRESSDFEFVRAVGKSKAIPHICQSICTFLQGGIGVLISQLEVSTKIPTPMANSVSG